ncbi:MAG: hypothetical protein WA082_05105 [Candidatus Moraniibacteriota bacterium]
MEKKKITKTTKSGESDTHVGWAEMLLDGVFKSIQASFDGAFDRVHRMGHAFLRRVTRRAFLCLFAFLGILFLLVGFAQLLNSLYPFPGSGATIVGLLLLLICLVIYAFDQGDNERL